VHYGQNSDLTRRSLTITMGPNQIGFKSQNTFAFFGFGEFEWRHSRLLKLVTPLKNPGFFISRMILHSVLEVFAKYHLAWHLGTFVHKQFNYYALRNENLKCLLCYFDNYSIKTIEVTMTLSTSSRYPIARMLRRNIR
jgi:hypothetical protein